MTNFRVGDPYVQIDDGYARLPGKGYEALHPELKGLRPEDYPDIHKLRILSDVAPYSREYNQVSPSCRTQKLSRTRGQAQAPFRIRLSTQAQLWSPVGSFVLWKAGKLEWAIWHSVLPYTTTLAHARAGKLPAAQSVLLSAALHAG
jgi:hypothetical protein